MTNTPPTTEQVEQVAREMYVTVLRPERLIEVVTEALADWGDDPDAALEALRSVIDGICEGEIDDEGILETVGG
jgi:hypothetical protein